MKKPEPSPSPSSTTSFGRLFLHPLVLVIAVAAAFTAVMLQPQFRAQGIAQISAVRPQLMPTATSTPAPPTNTATPRSNSTITTLAPTVGATKIPTSTPTVGATQIPTSTPTTLPTPYPELFPKDWYLLLNSSRQRANASGIVSSTPVPAATALADAKPTESPTSQPAAQSTLAPTAIPTEPAPPPTSVPAIAPAPATTAPIPPTAIPPAPIPPTTAPVPPTSTPFPPTPIPPTPIPPTPIPPTPIPPPPTATPIPIPPTAVPAPPAGGDGVSAGQAEANFVAAINGYRAQFGLAPLSHNPALSQVGRNWASYMSSVNAIPHNPNIGAEIPAGWFMWAENVGMGNGTWQDLHSAFLASPGHEQNLRKADATQIGVGVVIVNGVMFTSHVLAGY